MSISWVKHHIPHTTIYQDILTLQVANDNQLIEQHKPQGPATALYTSKFAVTSLIDATDTWLESKRVEDTCSLKKSLFFSILVDDCEDVSTQ